MKRTQPYIEDTGYSYHRWANEATWFLRVRPSEWQVSWKFSVAQHVDAILAGCAQTLFLRQHGMPDNAIRAVFQATVVTKLSYAAPAWWGYASAADRSRLEAYLRRRSVSFGYRDGRIHHLLVFVRRLMKNCSIKSCLMIDISYTDSFLPPDRSQHYSLRHRRHNLQLPIRTSALKNNNFLIRRLL
jgi:hypothetical protein